MRRNKRKQRAKGRFDLATAAMHRAWVKKHAERLIVDPQIDLTKLVENDPRGES